MSLTMRVLVAAMFFFHARRHDGLLFSFHASARPGALPRDASAAYEARYAASSWPRLSSFLLLLELSRPSFKQPLLEKASLFRFRRRPVARASARALSP